MPTDLSHNDSPDTLLGLYSFPIDNGWALAAACSSTPSKPKPSACEAAPSRSPSTSPTLVPSSFPSPSVSPGPDLPWSDSDPDLDACHCQEPDGIDSLADAFARLSVSEKAEHHCKPRLKATPSAFGLAARRFDGVGAAELNMGLRESMTRTESAELVESLDELHLRIGEGGERWRATQNNDRGELDEDAADNSIEWDATGMESAETLVEAQSGTKLEADHASESYSPSPLTRQSVGPFYSPPAIYTTLYLPVLRTPSGSSSLCRFGTVLVGAAPILVGHNIVLQRSRHN
ncbi:hypothetical protein GLOTRDRAFT_129679 [Gloeophyllum trabeum ATCC 11539]|uniref:Uncharacterized protein n=1 Tax=Gloeophyllum trabeum (strain ATCC 11539 / FP-39264 / Madison 617) TaxID=670483 RepID=S7RLY0_GLOTA|nr:uncharacterized protein GLOTRDRAFT_129679 [Gloeophyllum trabeum ATCC 11539]EPQ55405.1 hypothetical protein GLOTRDRAFT_129679 [Gloeophyllum trabeum ATCC 11539]